MGGGKITELFLFSSSLGYCLLKSDNIFKPYGPAEELWMIICQIGVWYSGSSCHLNLSYNFRVQVRAGENQGGDLLC